MQLTDQTRAGSRLPRAHLHVATLHTHTSGWCGHTHTRLALSFPPGLLLRGSVKTNLQVKGHLLGARHSCPVECVSPLPSHWGWGEELGSKLKDPHPNAEFLAPRSFYDRSSPLSTKPTARLMGPHCQGEKIDY